MVVPPPDAASAVWTADAGNSALKLAVWAWPVRRGERPRVLLRRSLPSGPGLEAALAALGDELAAPPPANLAPLPPLVHGALSSVIGDDATARLVALLGVALGTPLAAPPPHGLVVRCRQPAAVGQDRLFAARGAVEALGRSAIVVDAGTAMTVDAVRVEGAAPEFLGGAIAAGPALLARALARGAAQLFEVPVEPGAPALGDDTASALRAGIVHGLRGAAAELMRRVGQEAGLAAAPRVLTGGARALLLEPTPCWSGELLVEPDLVHLGLLAALRDGW